METPNSAAIHSADRETETGLRVKQASSAVERWMKGRGQRGQRGTGATEHRVFCGAVHSCCLRPAPPGVCLIPTCSTTQTLSGLWISQRFSQPHQKTFSDNPHTFRNHRLWLSKATSQHLPEVTTSLHLCNPPQPSTAPSVTGLSRILHRFHPNLGLRKHSKLRPSQGAKISRV